MRGATGSVIFDINRKDMKANALLGTGSVIYSWWSFLDLFRSVDIVDIYWYWFVVY